MSTQPWTWRMAPGSLIGRSPQFSLIAKSCIYLPRRHTNERRAQKDHHSSITSSIQSMPRKKQKGPPPRSHRGGAPSKPGSAPTSHAKANGPVHQSGPGRTTTDQAQKKQPVQQNQRPIVPFLRGDRILLIGEGELLSLLHSDYPFWGILFEKCIRLRVGVHAFHPYPPEMVIQMSSQALVVWSRSNRNCNLYVYIGIG